MKILGKIMRWFLFSILFLLILVSVIFYTPDLSVERLKETYETEYSHYLDVQLDTLVSLTIHYEIAGVETDPVIVLLHGLFSSTQTFYPWREQLVEQGYRVVLIDLPGHGLSQGYPDGVVSQSRQAKAVFDVLEELAITELFIGGNSMGGGVSWFFASEYLDLFTIKGIVLIDAVYPMAFENEGSSLQGFFQSRLGQTLAKFTPRFLFKQVLRGVYGSASQLEEDTLTRYFELLRYPNRRSSFLALDRFEETTSEGIARLTKLKEANIPVLVIWGEEDSWISKDVALLFQNTLELSNEQVIIYPGLGHVPMEEDPETTLTDVLVFLENHR